MAIIQGSPPVGSSMPRLDPHLQFNQSALNGDGHGLCAITGF